LKPEFVDPFELTDEGVIFDAIMDLTDGQGKTWKLVKKSTLERLRRALSKKIRECQKLPTLQTNVDFTYFPKGKGSISLVIILALASRLLRVERKGSGCGRCVRNTII
jgi:hypothetical protein